MQVKEASSVEMVPGYGITTSKLINRLKSGKPGDTISDNDLTKVAGRDTRPGADGYAYLRTAMKHVKQSVGVEWVRVRNEGVIKCCNGDESLDVAKGSVRSIRRKTRSAAQSVSIARANGADPSTTNALAAQIGAINLFSSRKGRKVIEANPGFSPEATLSLFGQD